MGLTQRVPRTASTSPGAILYVCDLTQGNKWGPGDTHVVYSGTDVKGMKCITSVPKSAPPVYALIRVLKSHVQLAFLQVDFRNTLNSSIFLILTLLALRRGEPSAQIRVFCVFFEGVKSQNIMAVAQTDWEATGMARKTFQSQVPVWLSTWLNKRLKCCHHHVRCKIIWARRPPPLKPWNSLTNNAHIRGLKGPLLILTVV